MSLRRRIGMEFGSSDCGDFGPDYMVRAVHGKRTSE